MSFLNVFARLSIASTLLLNSTSGDAKDKKLIGGSNSVNSEIDEPKSIPKEVTLLREIEARYSAAHDVKMTVDKEVLSAVMNKTKKSKGSLYIKHPGKFRLEIDTPDKSLVIVDGKQIWIVEFPIDPAFDNTTRVLVSDSPDKLQAPVLLTFLMGKGSLLDHFTIKRHQETEHGSLEFEMMPIKETSDIQKILVDVKPSSKTILSMALFDQLQNKTTFSFSKVDFKSKAPSNLFKFKAPKGAETTRI